VGLDKTTCSQKRGPNSFATGAKHPPGANSVLGAPFTPTIPSSPISEHSFLLSRGHTLAQRNTWSGWLTQGP
jgi:hypothetical protein